MTPVNNTPEYKKYLDLSLWLPQTKIINPEDLIDSNDTIYPLFLYLYNKSKEEYKKFPKRKNHENPFLHPLNLVWDLKKAKINDGATFCVAIAHDLIEEKVDLYKKEKKIVEDRKGIKLLDDYELNLFKELEVELNDFCKKNNPACNNKIVNEIIETIRLLTRHKREFYYCSVSNIFLAENPMIKKMAVQVKLADRIHNIQSLETFDGQGRIYQCFKNMFILNNVKTYLREVYGPNSDPDKEVHPTDKLFKKCAKATYTAFLKVCYDALKLGVNKVSPILQFAFKKYALEQKGLWEVTKINKKETHPMRLFQGIVQKYSTRLHQQYDKFETMKKQEMSYCEKFFADFKFSKKQLQAIINYKDAYSLKEVITRLLYRPDYLIKGFTIEDVETHARVCAPEVIKKKSTHESTSNRILTFFSS